MLDKAFRQYANKKGLIPPDATAADEEEAMWLDSLRDIPVAFVARQLPTEVLRATLQERGYYVEPPRGWPRMGDEDG
jgi:hypothetical protein